MTKTSVAYGVPRNCTAYFNFNQKNFPLLCGPLNGLHPHNYGCCRP